MSELINFILSSEHIPENPNAGFWSKFVDLSDKNKTTEREDLIQRLIDEGKNGIIISPIDTSQKEKVYELIKGINLAHSVRERDSGGGEYINTTDIEVFFNGEELLEDKMNAIVAVALLALTSLQFDHSSWIPF